MANCSIPNSTPATGRISTRSSRRLRRQNSQLRTSFSAGWRSFQERRQAAALQNALRARKIQRWMFDVGPWTFSSSWRVKGAWWPSRSSKPSSPRKWRGRFDSYPLRVSFIVILSPESFRGRRIPWPNRDVIGRAFSASLGMTNNPKGGDLHVA